MLFNEAKLDVKEAGQAFGVNANAVWRWARKGALSKSGRRVYLEHVRSPKKILTSAEAVERFFAALAEADFDGDTDRQAAGNADPELIEHEGATP